MGPLYQKNLIKSFVRKFCCSLFRINQIWKVSLNTNQCKLSLGINKNIILLLSLSSLSLSLSLSLNLPLLSAPLSLSRTRTHTISLSLCLLLSVFSGAKKTSLWIKKLIQNLLVTLNSIIMVPRKNVVGCLGVVQLMEGIGVVKDTN